MALNPSGPISLGGTTAGQSIALELSAPGTAQIALNDTNVRTLAGVASGAITMPTDFWGKSSVFNFTLASGTNVNLRTAAIAAGWPGTGAVNATLPSANTIQASSTGVYALTINGTWPGGVTLTNQGLIVGRGGNGASGGTTTNSASGANNGAAAGPAVLVSVATTINNTGSINGGGGGGGTGGGYVIASKLPGGQGPSGGGGGIGVATGGAGGPSSTGQGRDFVGSNGSAGTTTVLGAGGPSTRNPQYGSGNGGAGGAGGGYGSAGATGASSSGAPTNYSGGTGGAGGGALVGNANVTWTAFGTRNGSIT